MLLKIAHIFSLKRLLDSSGFRIFLVYAISLIYLIALGYFISKDTWYLAAIPLILAAVWIGLARMNWLFWLVLICVPLSFPLKELMPHLSFNLFLPTEPLLAGLMLLFVFRIVLDRGFDRQVMNHPITQIILLQLIWIGITSLSSTMPMVSLKFLISRLWFLAVFFFIATQVFKASGNIRKFIWLYLIPLSLMVVVITIRHAGLGLFDQKASNPAVDPFFNDHTLYGAIMALMIPVAFGYLVRSPFHWLQKLGVFMVLVLLLTGLLFSYSRAAWVSLVGAAGVFLLVWLQIKGRTVFVGFLVLVALVLVFGKTVLMKMERNDQDSSDNLTEHVQSISNISTDASNLERLNRWSSAMRMIAEKPVFGFGPGTYMFQYAPFQKASQKTIISTNAADGGNAHSEYLGPMSEMGLVGGLLVLLLVFYSVRSGILTYYRLNDREMKMVAIAVTIGLITYYAHGIMNNFLDTDKASAGVWGFTAIIVALDLKSRKEKNQLPGS